MSIPKIQVIGWYECLTCGRYPWDCECHREAICVECEQSVEDGIESEVCADAPDGVHCWRVPEGDGFKLLTPRVLGEHPCANMDDGPGTSRTALSDELLRTIENYERRKAEIETNAAYRADYFYPKENRAAWWNRVETIMREAVR